MSLKIRHPQVSRWINLIRANQRVHDRCHQSLPWWRQPKHITTCITEPKKCPDRRFDQTIKLGVEVSKSEDTQQVSGPAIHKQQQHPRKNAKYTHPQPQRHPSAPLQGGENQTHATKTMQKKITRTTFTPPTSPLSLLLLHKLPK